MYNTKGLLGTLLHGHTDAASALLTKFGTLEALSQASLNELGSVSGMTPFLCKQLHASFQLHHLLANRPIPRHLHTEVECGNYLGAYFARKRTLTLRAVYLNVHQQILDHRVLAHGTRSFPEVSARAVVCPALNMNASAIILAHNHPLQGVIPSAQALQFTARVCAATRPFGISVIDHLLFTGQDWVSMAACGYESWPTCNGS
jgi:DNA repair protein RadC